MKYWATTIKIRVSEWEFTIPHVVRADTEEEADEYMDRFCFDFYPGSCERTDYGYEFGCGCPIVTYSPPSETIKATWADEQWKLALIGKPE